MKREIKLFCSSNVASVFFKANNITWYICFEFRKKKRKKCQFFFEKGAGVILNCVLQGGILGGRGYFTPSRGSKRHSHHLIELRLSDLNLINNTVQVFFKENLTESFCFPHNFLLFLLMIYLRRSCFLILDFTPFLTRVTLLVKDLWCLTTFFQRKLP